MATSGIVVLFAVLAYVPSDTSVLTQAELTELKLGVEVTGKLQAVTTSAIGPPNIPDTYRFKISMMAPEGQEVAKGTPILSLDTTELIKKLETRTTAMQSAAKEIEKKKIDLLRQSQDDTLEIAEAAARLRRAQLKTATPSELVSSIAEQQAKLDLEIAEIEAKSLKKRIHASERSEQAELMALESDLDRATADVQQIQNAITSMTRIAPRDGIITYITDWRGEKSKIGDAVTLRNNVIEIPDLHQMKAEGEVEEALAGRLKEGQEVTLYLDAHPDHEYSGRVTSISRSVQKKSWRNPLKIVRLEISIDETDAEKMRPGMRFKGTVETNRLISVLTVPLDAVFSTTTGPVAFRRTFIGFAEVPLMLGPKNRERVVVLDGLHVGDRISKRRQDS